MKNLLKGCEGSTGHGASLEVWVGGLPMLALVCVEVRCVSAPKLSLLATSVEDSM